MPLKKVDMPLKKETKPKLMRSYSSKMSGKYCLKEMKNLHKYLNDFTEDTKF